MQEPWGLVTVLEGCSAEKGIMQMLMLVLERWLSNAVGAEPMDSLQSQLLPAAIAGAVWGRFLVNFGHVREEDRFGQKQLSLHIAAVSALLWPQQESCNGLRVQLFTWGWKPHFPQCGAGAARLVEAPCPCGTTGHAPAKPLHPNVRIWFEQILSVLAAPEARLGFAQRPPASGASSAASLCHAQAVGSTHREVRFRYLLSFHRICVFNVS